MTICLPSSFLLPAVERASFSIPLILLTSSYDALSVLYIMHVSISQVLCFILTCLISSIWSLAPRMNNHERRNFKALSTIYNLTVYPNQLPILQHGAAGVPPGLFNEKASGRIDPVGNFTGLEDSIEYFFALAPVPQANPQSQAFTRIQLTEFTSGCPDVAASVVVFFTSVVNPNSPDNGKPLPPLKQVSCSTSLSTRHKHCNLIPLTIRVLPCR
jgi:hypothetical protein